MARSVAEVKKPIGYNELGDVTFVAINAADGLEVLLNSRDIDTVILVKNANAAAQTLTIKKGNGVQGVTDFTYSVPASSTKFIPIESGFFKNVSGADKGKIIFTGVADLSIAVISHP